MMAPEFDVAVAGGGLVGAAIAWGLARERRRVALLDEGDIAHRAARGNFALIWVQGKGLGSPQYGLWTVMSAEGWSGFAARLQEQAGIDVRHRRPGGFHLALSADELAARAALLAQIRNQPGMPRYEYEMVEPAALRAELPHAGPEVAGASYTRLDGHCDSLRLLRALHEGLRRAGGAYLPERRVRSIVPDRGEFRIVVAGGEVRAGSVVLAAGLDNERLAPMVGLEAPVRAQRGQILVTERTADFLHHPVSTVRQTEEGTVMIGDSQEESGPDARVGHEVMAVLADRAVRMFPALARLRVVRAWAALRVMTPDGFPIYEQSREFPGAFLATSHSGVTLAANHALALAPHIARGALPEAMFAPFSARRFHVQKAA